MSMRATGTFEVNVHQQAPYDTTDGISLGRATIDKRFEGDLDAISTVEMLSAGTAVKGSAGYVAIERVVGSLQGRAGSFVLQHSGTMERGEPSMMVTVVPDSGTGALAGITGRMTIHIVEAKHSFTFDYALDDL